MKRVLITSDSALANAKLLASKGLSAYTSVLSFSDEVAKESVESLDKENKPKVIQGWKNRSMLFGFKLLSRNAAMSNWGR